MPRAGQFPGSLKVENLRNATALSECRSALRALPLQHVLPKLVRLHGALVHVDAMDLVGFGGGLSLLWCMLPRDVRS